MEKERLEGWYWVIDWSSWGILFWNAKHKDWTHGGISCGGDKEFLEVDENRIVRQEPEKKTDIEDFIETNYPNSVAESFFTERAKLCELVANRFSLTIEEASAAITYYTT